MAGTREGFDNKVIAMIDVVLPPKPNGKAVITSAWGPRNVGMPNASTNHHAIDLSYTFNEGIGKYYFYSPIAGTVVSIGGKYNQIVVKDSGGRLHQFLHGATILVKNGQSVGVGTPLGTVGMTAPAGTCTGPHVHYAIGTGWNDKGKLSGKISPIAFWSGTKQALMNVPRQENGLPVEGKNEAGNVVHNVNIAESRDVYHNQYSEGSPATVSSYRPRMAATAVQSGAIGAVLPNRTPRHEPWPRVMNTNTEHINSASDEIELNTRLNMQLDPDSDAGAKLIGKLEGTEEIVRGPFWRR